MLFWLLITFLVLLVPLSMITIGILLLRTSLVGINSFFAYRSRRARKSKETWKFAHNFLGRIWLILGIIFLPLYTMVMFFTLNQGDSVVALVCGILILVSALPIILPILFVERGLHKKFDIFGKRLNPKD